MIECSVGTYVLLRWYRIDSLLVAANTVLTSTRDPVMLADNIFFMYRGELRIELYFKPC